MANIQELRRERAELVRKMDVLTNEDKWDAAKQRAFERVKDQAQDLDSRISAIEEVEARKDYLQQPARGSSPLPMLGFSDNHDPDDLRAVRSGREHRAMFPSLRDERVSFEGFGDFIQSMRSGRHDDRLESRAMTGAVGSDGGYSVPIQWERHVIDLALQSETIRPLVKNIPMTARTVRIPGWDTSDLSAGGVGGAIGYWVDEAGTITVTNPKQRQVELNAKKLAVLERSSLEMTEDALDFGEQVADQIAKTVGHYLDRAFIRGSGAGEPQGILNAPCKVTIDAEDGQVGSTLVLENAVKAYARMLPVAQRRMIWLGNPDIIPEVYTFSLSIGTAGSWVSPMSEHNGQFRLFGRPLYFNSHCSTLGTEGDLIALDPEAYAVGILGGSLRMDFSDHVYFTSAERAFRALIRCDGQCLVEDEITPAQGTNTWSPIVTIATR